MKLPNFVNVELGFLDAEHIGIGFDWTIKGDNYDSIVSRKYYESLLFICYFFQQFRNIYHTKLKSLRFIYNCFEEIKGNEFKLSESMPIRFPHHCISYAPEYTFMEKKYDEKYLLPFEVTESLGIEGKKFIGKLFWRQVSPLIRVPVFNLEIIGFNLFSKEIPAYPLDSLLAFYAYLLGRYKTEKGYYEELPEIFSEVATRCANVVDGPPAFEYIAMDILKPYFPTFQVPHWNHWGYP